MQQHPTASSKATNCLFVCEFKQSYRQDSGFWLESEIEEIDEVLPCPYVAILVRESSLQLCSLVNYNVRLPPNCRIKGVLLKDGTQHEERADLIEIN
ncbi:unnamed protein product [Soboliphyme baturini]|uniref:Uncharacterized protein n=1 Tax=Soboliphyme baturini TaxID=241478 RepID=A0A183IY24_9BILA|nr:unnamed protein product [Soboliphyme baturini]